MLAIAHALEGMERAESARLAGMDRQALRDALENSISIPLPPDSPEINPVERIWLYLREHVLSHRLLKNYNAIVEACSKAWNALATDTERLRSLTAYPWLPCVNH